MKTQLVGMKEFRAHMSSYSQKVQEGDVRIIVLKKNKPVFELKAIQEKEFALENIYQQVEEARKDFREGKTHTHEEMMKEFGLL